MFRSRVNITSPSPASLRNFPPLTRSHAVAALAVLAALLAQAPVEAQTSGIPLIPGVDGMRWGSPRHEVVARYGFPIRWTPVDSGFGLTYESDIAGRTAEVTYLVSGNRGLIAASYLVPIPETETCESAFGELSDMVSRRHPGIQPVVNRMDPGSLDPCESEESGTNTEPVSWKTPTTILGEMNRDVVWRDPNSAASVVLRLVESGLELVYRLDPGVAAPSGH